METKVFTHDLTVIEVSLDNLLYNINQIRLAIPGGLKVIAVVKDNAYGCGAGPVASILEQTRQADMFAVARYDEALQLRNDGVSLPILVLGRTAPGNIRDSSLHDIIYTLNDSEDLNDWTIIEKEIDYFINVDTGMTRMGMLPPEIDQLLPQLSTVSHLHCKGIYTHFTSADVPGTETVSQQTACFFQTLDKLKLNGMHPQAIHFSNSAASLRFPPEGCTHIRPGVMLYGCKPDPSQDFSISLKPVISLKSVIIKLKNVPKGTRVSYGGNYTTPEKTWIGVIPAGYAQGVPRYLSNKGEVIIRGKKFRIAGNVTMDYIMVDAGANPEICVGDEVVITGVQGEESISPDQIALHGNTIGYEVMCNLGRSVLHRYIHNGSIVREISGTIF
jgi:alanine racemase